MFCPHCGKEIQEDYNVCPYCGQTLKKIKAPENTFVADEPEKTVKKEPVKDSFVPDEEEKKQDLEKTIVFDKDAFTKKVQKEEKNSAAKPVRSRPANTRQPTPAPRKAATASMRPARQERPPKPSVNAQPRPKGPRHAAPKKSKAPVIITIVVIALAVVGGFFGYRYYRSTQMIKLELTSFSPVFETNVDGKIDIDVDQCSYKFKSNKSGDDVQSIKDSISPTDFKFSKKTDLSTGDKVTVSINLSRQDHYQVTGKKTFKVNYKVSEDDTTDDDTIISDDSDTTSTATAIEQRVSGKDTYVFANSSTKVLSDSELAEIKTKDQLRIAINEIYARKGYAFPGNSSVRSYFNAKSWYKPNESLTNQDNISVNAVEKTNLDKLKAMRTGTLAYDGKDTLNAKVDS